MQQWKEEELQQQTATMSILKRMEDNNGISAAFPASYPLISMGDLLQVRFAVSTTQHASNRYCAMDNAYKLLLLDSGH